MTINDVAQATTRDELEQARTAARLWANEAHARAAEAREQAEAAALTAAAYWDLFDRLDARINGLGGGPS